MSVYRFIGLESDIDGYRKLNRFGQSIDMPDDLARELILGAGPEQGFAGACALLPEKDFQSVGFTDSELRVFAIPSAQFGDKAADFLRKKRNALEALDSY